VRPHLLAAAGFGLRDFVWYHEVNCMLIADNILRAQLADVYFINGTAYAGKSTMCKMLAERYDMILCGENYGHDRMLTMVDGETQPNLNYFHTMGSFADFVTRTPEEYAAWIEGTSREVSDFEVTELIRLSGANPGKKIIVDTNIPCDLLWQISDMIMWPFFCPPRAWQPIASLTGRIRRSNFCFL
jgi:hypothetical protein